MAGYVIRRLLQMGLLFLVFLTVTWFLLHALPGDTVAQKFAGNPDIPPEEAAEKAGAPVAWRDLMGQTIHYI